MCKASLLDNRKTRKWEVNLLLQEHKEDKRLDEEDSVLVCDDMWREYNSYEYDDWIHEQERERQEWLKSPEIEEDYEEDPLLDDPYDWDELDAHF